MNLDQILAIGAAVLGWIIFGCVCSYALPQFIKIVKTKNTSSMSVVAYTAFIICAGLMASWGIGNAVVTINHFPDRLLLTVLSLVPNVLTNLLNVTINLISLLIKLHHLNLCKRYKINEIQLAKKLMADNKKGKGK
ncbi:MAG: hypothetical protein KBS35_01115 [Mycoplasma sp.]|nr:hypothetical protein [Candidatus Hennigella equi]